MATSFRNEVSDPSKLQTTSYRQAAQTSFYDWIIQPLKPDLEQTSELITLVFLRWTWGLRSLPIARAVRSPGS